MSNLTALQESLVDGLIKEFSRINPKVTPTNGKRFSFNSIDNCLQEEEKFLASIKKHNLTMIKVFEKQFKDELKDFTKEFGKAFTTQIGYTYQGQVQRHHDYENFIRRNQTCPKNAYMSDEFYLYIVSKTKRHQGDSRYNYCGDKDFTKVNVDFKREQVTMLLESGKNVSAYKIVGLSFCEKEYMYRKDGIVTSTLDEYVQTNKSLQRIMVEMSA